MMKDSIIVQKLESLKGRYEELEVIARRCVGDFRDQDKFRAYSKEIFTT